MVPELRFGGAEACQKHTDAIGREFGSERSGQRTEGGFGSAILGMQRQWVIAEDRAHEHDRRVASGLQDRQRFADEFCGGEKIDGHDVCEGFGRRVTETADRAAPRGRHDQIETAKLRGGHVDQVTAKGWRRNVAGCMEHWPAAQAGGRLSDLCQTFPAASRGQHPGAAAGQFERHRPAHARRCPVTRAREPTRFRRQRGHGSA